MLFRDLKCVGFFSGLRLWQWRDYNVGEKGSYLYRIRGPSSRGPDTVSFREKRRANNKVKVAKCRERNGRRQYRLDSNEKKKIFLKPGYVTCLLIKGSQLINRKEQISHNSAPPLGHQRF